MGNMTQFFGIPKTAVGNSESKSRKLEGIFIPGNHKEQPFPYNVHQLRAQISIITCKVTKLPVGWLGRKPCHRQFFDQWGSCRKLSYKNKGVVVVTWAPARDTMTQMKSSVPQMQRHGCL